jgi:hypothetical protein
VSHTALTEILLEFARQIRWAVLAQESWPVFHADLIDAGDRE